MTLKNIEFRTLPHYFMVAGSSTISCEAKNAEQKILKEIYQWRLDIETV